MLHLIVTFHITTPILIHAKITMTHRRRKVLPDQEDPYVVTGNGFDDCRGIQVTSAE